MVACVFQISVFTVMLQTGIRQFLWTSAMHKLCSTKLNINEMPSQIYIWSVCHLLFYILYIYVWIYENEAKGLISLTKQASFFSHQKLSPKGTI